MGTFDISNVKYRVVTPPRPNPLISYPLDNECLLVREMFGDAFQSKALQIAAAKGIDPSKVSVSITSRGGPTPLPRLLD
jgi:hypothetical protein